jgi:hypothetical protein
VAFGDRSKGWHRSSPGLLRRCHAGRRMRRCEAQARDRRAPPALLRPGSTWKASDAGRAPGRERLHLRAFT